MDSFERLQELGRGITQEIQAAEAIGDEGQIERLLRSKDEINRRLAEFVEAA